MTTERKVIIAGGILTLVFLIGTAMLLGRKGSSVLNIQQTIGDAALASGAKNAKVVLVEFADFQCPACGAAYPTVKKVLDAYPSQLAFYYRHFPIVPPHKNAYAAAYAAEAARQQGKFLEFYDSLFSSQAVWENENVSGEYFFNQFGQKLGLKKEKFLTDFKDKAIQTRVSRDFSAGRSLGVNSTPTFFLNGQKLTGVQNYETLKKKIDKILSE